MLRPFLALVAIGFPMAAFGETLISGAIYFDSENTLQEVLRLSGEKNNEAIGRLVDAHHVSTKVTENADIQVYLAGPGPTSPAEFRFTNNPTTYWTLTKFIEGIRVTYIPTPTPITPPPATIPVALPTPTPNSTPNTPNATPRTTPTPTPTPSPKPAIALREREDLPEDSSPPPRKHHRRTSPPTRARSSI